METLQVNAERPARLLAVTGEPLGEPVVAYGPFVMNSEAEIRQAYVDFHSGKFGGPTPAALELADS
jgi:quercetin 2,3-dioxygenase